MTVSSFMSPSTMLSSKVYTVSLELEDWYELPLEITERTWSWSLAPYCVLERG
jgi:hypothetical protein